jgi:hypothetical protein
MPDIWHVLATASVSAAVSGFVVFAARTWFKVAIENRYHADLENLRNKHALEMELLKAELASRTSLQSDAAQRRDVAYRRLAELIYRTRNMCRDISAQFPRLSVSLLAELQDRLGQLTELLYLHRLDLQEGGLFHEVHQYKTAGATFARRTADLEFLRLNPASATGESDCDIGDLYRDVEKQYETCIATLASCAATVPGAHLPVVERQTPELQDETTNARVDT